MWDVLLVGLAVLVLVILSPLIIAFSIYLYIKEKILDRKFNTYLTTIEGAKYFCYTNRQTSQSYVETNLLPYLPPVTKIIYLGDSKKTIVLGDDTKFVFHLVAKMKMTKGGFPYIAKVSKGKLVAKSINNELYSAIRRNKEADLINDKTCRFLED